MKNIMNKFYVISVCFIFICTGIVWYICNNENSTKNILVHSLYNTTEKKQKFDEELLEEYNAKNMEKISMGEDLCAEDYFFIAYEYCVIKKDRDEGIKYAYMFNEKKGAFSDRFIQLYNDYLIDYYCTYIKHDEDVFEKLDNEFDGITISNWNRYTNLMNLKLSLFNNFDGGTEYIMNKIQDILKEQEKLDTEVVITLKDSLASMYKQKGYNARVLEICIETKSLLEEHNIEYGDAYKARALSNEAHVYTMLSDNSTAEKLLKEAMDIDIKNDILGCNTKVMIINQLMLIYFNQDDIDKVLDLINKYGDVFDNDIGYNLDTFYYLSMAQYYMQKYEKEKSAKDDLNKAEYYIELSNNSFSGYIGVENIDIDLYKYMEAIYLEYLKGDVKYALNEYNKLLDTLSDKMWEIKILEKMYQISYEEGEYEEFNKYANRILEIKNEEVLLINKDYSSYSIEKYKNELEIRRLNEEKIYNYIKWFIGILFLSIVVIIVIMKNRILREKNITDGLTEINNRAYFDEVYNKKLKGNKDFYLYMFDIDDFKKVNDTYGHLVGDEVLKRVAKVAEEVVVGKGSIFRYGGEEFVVLTSSKEEIEIIYMAEEIRKRIRNLTWNNGMKITISMGIANSGEEKEKVLKIADSRMYISKITGKNKVTFIS
ncbi:MAG: GGDEF domain-containing protein [Romboutsia sp.]|nr:GGDEF domain-containing protein [Romboutsia sp.]